MCVCMYVLFIITKNMYLLLIMFLCYLIGIIILIVFAQMYIEATNSNYIQ